MNISWLNKNKNILDGIRNIFSDADANQVKNAVNSKQDAISGKGLSTNDFDNTYKSKLDNAPGNINQAFSDEALARNEGDAATLVAASDYAYDLLLSYDPEILSYSANVLTDGIITIDWTTERRLKYGKYPTIIALYGVDGYVSISPIPDNIENPSNYTINLGTNPNTVTKIKISK